MVYSLAEMRVSAFIAVSSVALGTMAAMACGSDADDFVSAEVDGGADADADGSESTGGRGAGGRAGSGGAGKGGAGPACDPVAMGCDPITAFGLLPLAPCCIDENTCGGLVVVTCVPEDDLASQGTPVDILDGGIIPVGDGGAPIHLDESCPSVSITVSVLGVSLPDLPGCCTPEGRCGGSNHLYQERFGPTPLSCTRARDVEANILGAAAAADAGEALDLITVSEDPNQPCDYPGASPTPDAGPPEAGLPEAAVPEAAPGETGTGESDGAAADGAVVDGAPDGTSVGDALAPVTDGAPGDRAAVDDSASDSQ